MFGISSGYKKVSSFSGVIERRGLFVASGFEWFTASRSVAVESCLIRLLKETSKRAKIEGEKESGRERASTSKSSA